MGLTETLAEDTQRPLYNVSAGELSTGVDKLEARLKSIFKLGKKWQAVVLLDEADVLMFKRDSANLERNAIVAGMLSLFVFLLFC